MIDLVPARRVAALLISVAVLAAGCADSGPVSSAPAPSLPPGALAISATGYAFTPPTLVATAGDVTFAVKNDDDENHEFEVLRGEEVLGKKLEAIAPGTTRSVTISLPAGTYTFACRLNGHDLLGMNGTLTVQ